MAVLECHYCGGLVDKDTTLWDGEVPYHEHCYDKCCPLDESNNEDSGHEPHDSD